MEQIGRHFIVFFDFKGWEKMVAHFKTLLRLPFGTYGEEQIQFTAQKEQKAVWKADRQKCRRKDPKATLKITLTISLQRNKRNKEGTQKIDKGHKLKLNENNEGNLRK